MLKGNILANPHVISVIVSSEIICFKAYDLYKVLTAHSFKVV